MASSDRRGLGLRRLLRRRRLPSVGDADLEACRTWREVGRAGERALALKRLVGLGAPPAELRVEATAALAAAAPAERAAGAWVLGQLATGAAVDPALDQLWPALRRERCDAVRRTMALAAVRCGAQAASAWAVLEAASRRRMATFFGPRATAGTASAGRDETGRLWRRAMDPLGADAPDRWPARARSAASIREWAHGRLDADPEDREALRALALQQHPDDLERVAARKWVSGRRESHWICEALGLHGDPRGIPDLVRVLRAMDVDPGHGFAGRRAAATALGRIGDPAVASVLTQALRDEAADHEGRPGAGMGIQFPVRSVMIAALGEAGCVEARRVVAAYLSDDSGSALGGFYLPAMDALWKLGRRDVLAESLTGAELPAANAVGVLAALGYLDEVRACLDDPRPGVARAAAQALELRGERG